MTNAGIFSLPGASRSERRLVAACAAAMLLVWIVAAFALRSSVGWLVLVVALTVALAAGLLVLVLFSALARGQQALADRLDAMAGQAAVASGPATVYPPDLADPELHALLKDCQGEVDRRSGLGDPDATRPASSRFAAAQQEAKLAAARAAARERVARRKPAPVIRRS